MTTDVEKLMGEIIVTANGIPIVMPDKLHAFASELVSSRARIAELEGSDAGRLVLELNRRASQIRELEEQLDVARLGFVKATQEAVSVRAELEGALTIPRAMAHVCRELQADPGYRIGWVANIAMQFVDRVPYDSDHDACLTRDDVHRIANQAAEGFIDLLCYCQKQSDDSDRTPAKAEPQPERTPR